MTRTYDPAIAVRARIVGEWSNRHLMAFGPLLPNAYADVLCILGAHDSTGAAVLRRLLVLIHQEHNGAGTEQVLEYLTRPEVPPTLAGMTSALVSAIMDQDGGADILPVDADRDPENWDAIRSARLFLETGK